MVTLISLIPYGSGVAGKRLEKILQERFPEIDQEVYDGRGSFYKRLCRPVPGGKNEIYVVLTDTPELLEKLMGMKKLLEGRRLVLVLPGTQKKLFSMSHRLLPRYVSCGTDNHEELVSVLKKMIDVLTVADKKKSSGDEIAAQPEQGRPALSPPEQIKRDFLLMTEATHLVFKN